MSEKAVEKAAKSRKKAEKEPTFEQMMETLEETVGLLESGGMGLQESLAAYERAIELSKKLNSLLDEGEKRMMELTDSGEKPFAAEDIT